MPSNEEITTRDIIVNVIIGVSTSVLIISLLAIFLIVSGIGAY